MTGNERGGGPDRLLAWAARRLDAEAAQRYEEEWRADLSYLDSRVARWYFAICIATSVHRMGRDSHKHLSARGVLNIGQYGIGLLGIASMVALKISPNPVLVPFFLLSVPFVIRLGLSAPNLAGRFLVNTALEINQIRMPVLAPTTAVARPVRPAPRVVPRTRTAVIITALQVEQNAVAAHLVEPPDDRLELEVRGTVYEVGTFRGTDGAWMIPIVQAGPGNTSAGIQLERAMSVFNPDLVLFVGVAGGLKDVRLGDVVAAETVLDYEQGKIVDGLHLPRIRSHQSPHRLVQRAQVVARRDCWQRRVIGSDGPTSPAAVVKPIAAGSKVVADDRSHTARLLRHWCSEAVAVETEGFGFLQSAYLNGGIDAVVIRGVSDLLSDKEPEHDLHWQAIAARNAAAFAFELLDGLGKAQPE